MKQVNIHARNDVRLDDVQPPPLSDGDVRIKVEACGICGSDLHYFAAGGALFGSTLPMPLGHEYAGIVVEPGLSRLKAGQRVVVNPAKAMRYGVIGNTFNLPILTLTTAPCDQWMARAIRPARRIRATIPT